MRPSGSPKELERRRARAIRLLMQDHQAFDVARLVEVDRRNVRRWNRVYREAGGDDPRAKPASGRPPKVDSRAKDRLERVLLKGAKAAGFPTALCTWPRVAQLIRDGFGVNRHVDHMECLLRDPGWSPQKPQRRAV